MNDIAGIPYAAAHFDKDGAALDKQKITVPDGTTDVIVVSHGWNNTEEQAEQLYIPLFTNFAAVASDQLQEKKMAIVGVIWPSKKFTDVVDAAVAEQGPGGGAGFGGSSTAADETIKAKLDVIATMFDKKAAKKITAAKNQIGKLESDLDARRKFVDELRSLLDDSAAQRGRQLCALLQARWIGDTREVKDADPAGCFWRRRWRRRRVAWRSSDNQLGAAAQPDWVIFFLESNPARFGS